MPVATNGSAPWSIRQSAMSDAYSMPWTYRTAPNQCDHHTTILSVYQCHAPAARQKIRPSLRGKRFRDGYQCFAGALVLLKGTQHFRQATFEAHCSPPLPPFTIVCTYLVLCSAPRRISQCYFLAHRRAHEPLLFQPGSFAPCAVSRRPGTALKIGIQVFETPCNASRRASFQAMAIMFAEVPPPGLFASMMPSRQHCWGMRRSGHAVVCCWCFRTFPTVGLPHFLTARSRWQSVEQRVLCASLVAAQTCNMVLLDTLVVSDDSAPPSPLAASVRNHVTDWV